MGSLPEYVRKRRFDRGDIGTYTGFEDGDVERGLREGALKIVLKGKKLKGAWRLVRTRGRQWLLMKSRDRYASTEDVTVTKPRSVVTRRLMAGIARDSGGDIAHAATADPPRQSAVDRATTKR